MHSQPEKIVKTWIFVNNHLTLKDHIGPIVRAFDDIYLYDSVYNGGLQTFSSVFIKKRRSLYSKRGFLRFKENF